MDTAERQTSTVLAGRVRLDRVIGEGGMGIVHAGIHVWTGRAVAVKRIHPERVGDPSLVDRFLQEARAATQLRHPNVVDVLDMGRDDDGTVYLVMELLEGESLSARLARGRLPVLEALSLLLPVMDAVAVAHERGIVHRDIKPDNVFLSRDAWKRLVPKLLDFGLAAVRGPDGDPALVGVDGTPDYMSPERVRGDDHAGPAADVWSMGCLLFEAVTGRPPFDAEVIDDTLARIVDDTPAPSFGDADLEPAPGPALLAALDRALAKDPAERHPHMDAFVDALLAAADEDAEALRVVRPSRESEDLGAATGAVWAPSAPGMRRVSGVRPVAAAVVEEGTVQADGSPPLARRSVVDASGVQRVSGAGAPTPGAPTTPRPLPGRWIGVGIGAAALAAAVFAAVASPSSSPTGLVDHDRASLPSGSPADPTTFPRGRDVPADLVPPPAPSVKPSSLVGPAPEAAPVDPAAPPPASAEVTPDHAPEPLGAAPSPPPPANAPDVDPEAAVVEAPASPAPASSSPDRGANGALILDVE